MCFVKVIGIVSDIWYWYFDKKLFFLLVDFGVYVYSFGVLFCLYSLLFILSYLCF